MSAPRAPLVLIVEDEPDTARLLGENLEDADLRTQWVADGLHAIEAVRSASPDLVLLDLLLPGCHGLAVCREVRKFSRTPIIVLSGFTGEGDRLLGLEMGADDYICKPFSAREVVARVRAVLRRTLTPAETLTVQGLLIDDDKHVAVLDGEVLPLTPTEFRLIALLARAPGRVFARDQLRSCVAPDEHRAGQRAVDVHVRNLRSKLHTVRPGHSFIGSVYGSGYQWRR